MRLRSIIVCLQFLACVGAVRADDLRCAVCGQVIAGEYRYTEDLVTGEKKNICLDCAALTNRCFACSLPVKEKFHQLPDGRILCERDAAGAVSSPDQARDICDRVAYDLDRLLSRFMAFPGTNVEVSVVDKFHLENLFHAPGFSNACVLYYGATASNPLPDGRYYHTIDLLSYLKKSRLMAVCAHEYTHAWMGENVTRARIAALDKNTVEGFCELVAYKYMESRQEPLELESIKRNTYTHGQIDVLVEADRQYGFNTVLEWIKSGEDSRLDLMNLDRVRAVEDATYVRHESPAARTYDVPRGAPAPAPDKLVLKGISGTQKRPFVLINNATFEPLEQGRVRVGESNVTVRCLEIRRSSVVIQVDGSGEKKELFLSGK